MTDNILSIALTFVLLIGGTAAIGSELIGSRSAPAPIAKADVTLPTVVVTGHREAPTRVAVVDTQRVQ
jgi:hypothetical protein